MGVLGIILLVIFIITSLILIFLVVIQNENTQGLGGIFGGSSESTFGSRSGNILTKITYIVAGTFLCLTFLLAFVNRTPEDDALLRETGSSQEQSEWWNEPLESQENDESQDEGENDE